MGRKPDNWETGDCNKGKKTNTTMCFFVTWETQFLHHILVMVMVSTGQHSLQVCHQEEIALRETVGRKPDDWETGDCDKGKKTNMRMCFFVPRQTQHLRHIVVMAIDPPVRHLSLVHHPQEIMLRETVGIRADDWGTGYCDEGKNMNTTMCFFVT